MPLTDAAAANKKRAGLFCRSFFACFFSLTFAHFACGEAGGREKIIRVGVSFSIPPWVVQESNSGIELELLSAALKFDGYTVRPVYVPFERSFALFETGEVDAVVNARPGAVSSGYYSDVFVYFQNVAISLARRGFDRQIPMEKLLNSKVVAFQRASEFLGEKFKVIADSNPDYEEVANQQLQINLLFFRDVEFIVMEQEIFRFFHQQAIEQADLNSSTRNTLKQAVTLHPMFAPTPYRIVFRDKKTRDDFNRGLQRLKDEGIYQSLTFQESAKQYSD
jgi:polar amino acid transport system substrate-binding protein